MAAAGVVVLDEVIPHTQAGAIILAVTTTRAIGAEVMLRHNITRLVAGTVGMVDRPTLT